MEEAPAFVETLIQQVNMRSPLCRFWTIVMAKNVPAHAVEPWAETDNLDDAQRIHVQHLLQYHYNARLQGGHLSANDMRVDLFEAKPGLPLWDLTRVPAEKISEKTRIHVQLETTDQVWCRPDASLACKALELCTKNDSISKAQLRAEFEAFQAAHLKTFKGPPCTSLDDVAGVCSQAHTRSCAASSGKGSSVGFMVVAASQAALAAQRAKFQEDKAKEKKSTTAFLKKFNLTLEDVLAQGDCFFLSVAQQLARLRRMRDGGCSLILPEERDNLAISLRADAVRCMRNPLHAHHFADFVGAPEGKGNALDGDGDKDFGGYLKRMSRPGQFGDELTAKALAIELDVSIQIFAWNSTLNEIQITRHSSNPDVNPPTNGGKPDADNVRATQGTVNVFLHVKQHGGSGHYNSIMEKEVKRSMHA